ncbi:TatD family hydrolase [Streptomyces sp. NPDC046261]|uniref:TatD family hydrolase n=1 Tax=Streptomyces sp. NPDC046261 TaxID=3157200 RepID=UPI0033CF9F30
MRIFDPHIHMTSRTTDDYEAMRAAGILAVVEPAFWTGQPRTNPGSFADYFDSLIGWEPFRAARFGIRHHCTLALNPKEANDPRCTPVLDLLPGHLAKDQVVAVGEVGYDSLTPQEDHALETQLQLAVDHGLPVLVHTPHRDKEAGTRRTLDVLRDSGIDPGMVLIDHLTELTVAQVADTGCWMGFSIYPDTKMDARRMVRILAEHGTDRMLVNSAADWGRSDPLATRRTAQAMLDAGFTTDQTDQVLWRNPVAFYGQSGRLVLPDDTHDPGDSTSPPPGQDPAATYLGNSILRGR